MVVVIGRVDDAVSWKERGHQLLVVEGLDGILVVHLYLRVLLPAPARDPTVLAQDQGLPRPRDGIIVQQVHRRENGNRIVVVRVSGRHTVDMGGMSGMVQEARGVVREARGVGRSRGQRRGKEKGIEIRGGMGENGLLNGHALGPLDRLMYSLLIAMQAPHTINGSSDDLLWMVGYKIHVSLLSPRSFVHKLSIPYV